MLINGITGIVDILSSDRDRIFGRPYDDIVPPSPESMIPSFNKAWLIPFFFWLQKF
jgi:hypothetical protein